MCSFETTSGCFFVLFTIILCLLVSLHQIHFFHCCWKLFCSRNFPLVNFTFSCDLSKQETWLASKLCRIKEFLQQESFQVYVFFMNCLSSFSKTTLKPFVCSFNKLVNIFWIFCWFYQTTGGKRLDNDVLELNVLQTLFVRHTYSCYEHWCLLLWLDKKWCSYPRSILWKIGDISFL